MQRSSWQIMCDSVHALLLREVKTRFGTSRLGYFWALVAPLAQALVIASLFTFIGRQSISDVPVALFIVVAILPYKLFSKLLPQLSAAVSANKALFGYRQVQPITPVITRLLIEITNFVMVYVIILVCFQWLGLDAIPDDFLGLLAAVSILVGQTLGVGLLLCCAYVRWPDTQKLVSILLTPMFFISGILYCATMIPEKYWFLISWNPILHLMELTRSAFFASYTTPLGSWEYVISFMLVVLSFGLICFHLTRQRFITL